MPLLNIHDDALTVMETLQSGGISIVQLDVAYLICANRAAAIERIFAAKGRSADKPNGMLGNWDIFEQLLITDKRQRDIVRAVTVDFDIPLSVVAPFRPDAPILSSLEPESVARSTKAGTQDILLNAGPLADRLAQLSLEQLTPVLGSSANRSETGSKYRLEDIEPDVLSVADHKVDYGLCRYHNPVGTSSTIIDLQDLSVLRWGVCFEKIRDILQRYFKVALPPSPHALTL